MAVLGSSQDSIYERIISAEQQRLEGLTNSKKVDPVVFNSEIKSIDQKIKGVRQSVNAALIDGGSVVFDEEFTYRLKLTKKYKGEYSNKYFCDYLDGYSFKEKYGTYLVVSLPSFVPVDSLVHSFGGIEVLVRGRAEKTKEYNKSDNMFYSIAFSSISQIVIEDHPLDKELARLMAAKDKLEKVDWIVPYTNKEMQDVESERKFLRKKIELLSSRQAGVKDFNSSIVSIVRVLRDSKKFFEKSSIGISEKFPNTMVFVQNPSYSLAKASFSKVSNVSGMDDTIFKAMMSVDEIGLVNISNLYEKWCLLQIIKVLTEVYSFNISEDWQHDLIDAVSNKKYNIQFKLISATLGRSIILTYEYQFEPGNPNSRRARCEV